MARRIHEAADREVRSGNIAPFASRKFIVSLGLRLFLRTSRTAGLLRLAVAAGAILAVAMDSTYAVAISALLVAAALATIITSWRSLLPRKAWEDPSIVGVNRLATHSRLGNYRSFDDAAARGRPPNVVSLSGTWKFLLVSGVTKSPPGFEDPDFADSSWDDINVPGHWQLQTAGARDPPIYTNTNYPFPNHPPYAPRNNPTGLYRRSLALPADWFSQEREGRPVSACVGGRVVLAFQGVDSAFHVWLNGVSVGFAKGSRLPCEFDVTDALRENGDQCLCLRVVRWSDGSYLEDQDHWWLSGVYRDVELVLRPAPARISDFMVRPFLDEDEAGNYTKASLEVEVLMERDTARPSQSFLPLRSTRPRGWLPRMAGGPAPAAAAVSGDGASSDQAGIYRSVAFSLEKVEAGEGNGREDDAPPRGSDGEEITCTLVDTKTGARYPLAFAEALPDWKMGLPPAQARRRGQGAPAEEAGAATPRDFLGTEAAYASEEGMGGGTLGGTEVCTLPPVTRKSVRLFRLQLPGSARAWSAEDPQLYTLVIGLTGSEGEPLQYESARVGFRSVRVASGQLLVNGRAVMVAGVNRHEHDPDTGKSVSEESMRRDIIMMKRFNFNAVRNCHYPNHWRWYELCDELGLYVCDEANIESHGQIPLCRLSADPYWRLAYLDRVWRMLAANKNHACIVLWSLGNESGDGDNLLACRRLVKEVDPSRPVVYEGGGESLAEGCGFTELTDVVCPMYSTVDKTELLGTDGPRGLGETRPCVLCEYSHAMGNSCGNIHKYWEIFRKHRRLQGGFIWDWVDQGLTKHDSRTGRRYWADGSGFDGRHSEGYDLFCMNGLTFPDRSPHPSLWEAKFLAQPVGIDMLRSDPSTAVARGLKSAGTARLLLTNRYDFLSLDHLSATWRLKSAAAGGADAFLAAGSIPLAGLASGSSSETEIDFGDGGYRGGGEHGAGRNEEIFLHVEARLSADSDWAPQGHLVAWGCFNVESGIATGKPGPPPVVLGSVPLPGVLHNGDGGGVGGGESVAVVGTVSLPPPALIVYDDEEEDSACSREGSPMGQLREHLLTDAPTQLASSSLIVVKGLLNEETQDSVVEGGGSAERRLPREWMLAVSRKEGTIVRFVAGGVDLIEPGGGPSLCLWRAATDNDRAGWPTLMKFVADQRLVGFISRFLPLSRLSHLDRWRSSGLCATEPPTFETRHVRVEKSSGHECVIKVEARCKASRRRRALFDVTTEIRVFTGGKVEVETTVDPLRGAFEGCVSFARVGLELRVPAGFGRVEWFGKGPFECYQDRKHGAKTDVFSGAVEDQHVPYINPSENGGKADVRWMVLRRGQGGAGVLLKAENGAVFQAASCSLYSAAELQEAKRTVDLPLRNSIEHPVFVNLDHRSMGVGGDNSWYPNVVHEEFTVPATSAYRFTTCLEALAPESVAPSATLRP